MLKIILLSLLSIQSVIGPPVPQCPSTIDSSAGGKFKCGDATKRHIVYECKTKGTCPSYTGAGDHPVTRIHHIQSQGKVLKKSEVEEGWKPCTYNKNCDDRVPERPCPDPVTKSKIKCGLRTTGEVEYRCTITDHYKATSEGGDGHNCPNYEHRPTEHLIVAHPVTKIYGRLVPGNSPDRTVCVYTKQCGAAAHKYMENNLQNIDFEFEDKMKSGYSAHNINDEIAEQERESLVSSPVNQYYSFKSNEKGNEDYNNSGITDTNTLFMVIVVLLVVIIACFACIFTGIAGIFIGRSLNKSNDKVPGYRKMDQIDNSI